MNFDWFRGSPPFREVWVGGWGLNSVTVFGAVPYACAHVHADGCMCARVWAVMSWRDSPGFPYGSRHLHEIIMSTTHACACVCVCACACMCTCVGVPSQPPPTPRAAGSWKHQISISLELIEIIRFCLKILYLWTFLNSYRLWLITPDTPTHLPHPPD